MRAIERLAEWTLAIEPAGTSALALRQARLLLLDSIGCAYAAIESGAADPIRELAVELGGPAEATIIGSPDRASVLNAVLANGALVRVLDLNDVMFTERDGHLAIGGHRSDNIPVALAVAEKCGGSGRQVLEAIVLNYELYGRLRELMPEDAPWDGASASALSRPRWPGG
jgi:2-methylcitrate dehydratase